MEEQGPEIYIVDFKSSDVRTQEDADKKVKESLQLSIYALAWQKMFGKIPEALELNFIETGLVGSARRNDRELQVTWEKVKAAAENIRAADYRAKPGKFYCGYCAYNDICPSSMA